MIFQNTINELKEKLRKLNEQEVIYEKLLNEGKSVPLKGAFERNEIRIQLTLAEKLSKEVEEVFTKFICLEEDCDECRMAKIIKSELEGK